MTKSSKTPKAQTQNTCPLYTAHQAPSRINPWAWVSSLYFAEGLPYVVVMTLAVILYKNLGLSNTDIALYTSWLYLPWVIKPIWSPIVDVLGQKRNWIIVMQFIVAVAMAGIAFTLPGSFFLQSTLAFFWLLAFASATHDIAADGFYMIGLTQGDQSLFVGIRNTFYRLATIFVQGFVVMLVGLLYEGHFVKAAEGNYILAWRLTFVGLAILMLLLALYHFFVLPRHESVLEDSSSEDSVSYSHSKQTLEDETGTLPLERSSFWDKLVETFVTFFQKPHAGLMFFFILTYRLGESQLVKIATPFMLDDKGVGGLAMDNTAVGLIYGTFGVIALLLGGIVGGVLVSKKGFKTWILWMALLINLPDLLYVVMALTQPSFVWVTLAVIVEQLGYGFGFTAYMLYLIYVAEGPHKTAHYALGTGFMALGMMLPGMLAGFMADQLGYVWFFVWVCFCTLPGLYATFRVKQFLPDDFGKKK